MNLFDPALSPVEARHRLEQIPGPGVALAADDVAALKSLLAENELLARVAAQARTTRLRQRAYFRGKLETDLLAAKQEERRLDLLLAEVA